MVVRLSIPNEVCANSVRPVYKEPHYDYDKWSLTVPSIVATIPYKRKR